MILEERTVIYEGIRLKGRRGVSEEAINAMETLAERIRALLDEIEKAPERGSTEMHDAWTRMEWAIADASIALDELEYVYCDNPIRKKRASLLRAKAAGYGLIGGGEK